MRVSFHINDSYLYPEFPECVQIGSLHEEKVGTGCTYPPSLTGIMIVNDLQKPGSI